MRMYNYLLKLSFKKHKTLCFRTWFRKHMKNVNIGGKYQFNPNDWTNNNRYHRYKFATYKNRQGVNLHNKITYHVEV